MLIVSPQGRYRGEHSTFDALAPLFRLFQLLHYPMPHFVISIEGSVLALSDSAPLLAQGFFACKQGLESILIHRIIGLSGRRKSDEKRVRFAQSRLLLGQWSCIAQFFLPLQCRLLLRSRVCQLTLFGMTPIPVATTTSPYN